LWYTITNNNAFMLHMCQALGLKNIVSNTVPLMKWIRKEISDSEPDPQVKNNDPQIQCL